MRASGDPPAAPSDAVFDGGGEMGALMRTIDWSASPVGPVERWPQSLRTAVSIILRSKFPMFVFWGPELIQLYNDAYVPIPGAKHPRSQGAPARETWAEIWDVLGPLVESVVERGEATWSEDQLLMMDRHGFTEETYFTFSYSPVADESGVGGVFCACTETTDQVLATRRIALVRDLAERTREARDPEVAAGRVLDVVGVCPEDLPGVAVYLADGATARLAGAVGFTTDVAGGLPSEVSEGDTDAWGLGEVLATQRSQAVPDLAGLQEALPRVPWGEPPREVQVLPLADASGDQLGGLLVVGLSARRVVDDEYETFLHLVQDSVANALADARARQREQERIDALAALNRAKSEFFSNVSHEFRTPLTLMLGPLEQALAEGEVLDGASTQRVHRNATRLLKLVNSLLDFSRLEAGRLRPVFRPVDLAALTEELASVFRSAIEDAGLDYRVACPPLSGPVHVDPEQYEKIVLNLLSNALKFTREGAIDVRLTEQEGAAVVEVTDTGVGVAPEHLPHLFDRFYRVDGSYGRSYEGSGIGLALVRDLVELHGGTIEVDSEVGRGTTFRVTIPGGTEHIDEALIVADPGERSGVGVRQAYVAEATGWLSSQELVTAELRAIGDLAADSRSDDEILIVDDNADMRRYLVELLAPHWRIRVASDGVMALAELRDRLPALILTDVMMPRVDGFGLLEAVRSDPRTRDIPVVMLSARAAEEAASDGLGAGADDYVVKPFTASQLIARVRANLELARMRTQLAADRSRVELLAGVSHELQTPLAVVLGALSQIGADGVSDEDSSLLLGRALARGRHLRLLVQQFLDHADIEAGEPVVAQTTAVELAPLVHEVLSLTDQRGRTVVSVPDDLRVEADADRLAQILVNLLGNALHYSPGKVEVTAEHRGGEVVVSVVDDGPGVAPDERDRIFERFYRGTAAVGTRGAGLGLFVSRVLAEAQRGRLVVGEPERGARFDLHLPAAEPAGAS